MIILVVLGVRLLEASLFFLLGPQVLPRAPPCARVFVVGADAVALAARAGDALVEEDAQVAAFFRRGAAEVKAGAPARSSVRSSFCIFCLNLFGRRAVPPPNFTGVSLPVSSYPCNPCACPGLVKTRPVLRLAGTLLSKRYYTYM